jgi:hypothetical protein
LLEKNGGREKQRLKEIMKHTTSIRTQRFAGKMILTAAGVAAIAVPWILNAQSPSYTVTTTIHDDSTPTSGADLSLRSDDINPPADDPFAGTYIATNCSKMKCSSSLTSQVTSGGYSLLLFNQSLRTVHLHFVPCSFQTSNPTVCSPNGTTPVVNDGNYSESVELYVRCYDGANQVIDFLAISPGSSYNRCLLGMDFTAGRTKYKLVMGPYIASQGSNQPHTGWASVTCTTAIASPMPPCTNWTIADYLGSDTGNYPTTAALYEFSRNGSLVFRGSYINTFRVDLRNP